MPQVIYNLSFGEYCLIERMNPSTLVHGRTSMRALKYAMQGRTKEPTQAMQFGNKYHSLILEPEDFEQRFLVMPNFAASPENVTAKGDKTDSWATTYAKESKRSFESMAFVDGKQVITREEYDRGLYMCESVMSDPYAAEIIKSSKREVTLLGEISGIEFKGRIDLCGDTVLADLKGTNKIDAIGFGNSCANLKYAFKMAIYRELYRQNFDTNPEVAIIAIETSAPFDCCVYDEMDAAIEDGLDQALNTITAYKNCLASGNWPGVNRGRRSVPLYVPNWAMPEDDLEVEYVPE